MDRDEKGVKLKSTMEIIAQQNTVIENYESLLSWEVQRKSLSCLTLIKKLVLEDRSYDEIQFIITKALDENDILDEYQQKEYRVRGGENEQSLEYRKAFQICRALWVNKMKLENVPVEERDLPKNSLH